MTDREILETRDSTQAGQPVPEGEGMSAAGVMSKWAYGASIVAAFIVGIALFVAPVALAGVGLFASYKGLESLHNSIFHLGTGPVGIGNAHIEKGADGLPVVIVHATPSPESVTRAQLSAAATVGTLVLLAVVIVVLSLKRKRRTLFIAGLMLIIWLAINVVLAMVDTWLSVASLNVEANILTAGQFLYAALPALPVIPLVWLLSSASHEPEDKYETMSAAAGDVLKAILKSVLTVAMWLIEFFFGFTIGVSPVAAIFVGGVNALTFSKALGEAEKARHENDRAGVHLWGAVAVIYALLAFVISAEAIITFSVDPVTGASRLNALHASPEMQSAAQWIYISSLGISFVLLAVMEWRRQGSLVGKAPAKPARPVAQVGRNTTGGWSVKGIKTQLAAGRDSLRRAAGKLTGRPALPAGTPAPDVFQPTPADVPVPVEATENANPRRAENGTAYAATAQVADAPAQGWPTPADLPADSGTPKPDPKAARRRRA